MIRSSSLRRSNLEIATCISRREQLLERVKRVCFVLALRMADERASGALRLEHTPVDPPDIVGVPATIGDKNTRVGIVLNGVNIEPATTIATLKTSNFRNPHLFEPQGVWFARPLRTACPAFHHQRTTIPVPRFQDARIHHNAGLRVQFSACTRVCAHAFAFAMASSDALLKLPTDNEEQGHQSTFSQFALFSPCACRRKKKEGTHK